MEDDRQEHEGSDPVAADSGPPLTDLVEEVRASRSEADSFGEDDASYFADQSIDEIDSDLLWKSLESDWAYEVGADESSQIDNERVVPKRWYCERCQYFSNPPEVDCEHPGTTIVEFVESDQVRVRNCPVVAERDALGESRRRLEDSS